MRTRACLLTLSVYRLLSALQVGSPNRSRGGATITGLGVLCPVRFDAHLLSLVISFLRPLRSSGVGGLAFAFVRVFLRVRNSSPDLELFGTFNLPADGSCLHPHCHPASWLHNFTPPAFIRQHCRAQERRPPDSASVLAGMLTVARPPLKF